jgi:hypothetical protein
VIRKRYRIFVSSFLFAFVLFLPVSGFLDKIFPPNLIMPLILLYFGFFLIPGIVFSASRCPKCQKPLLALNVQVLRNIANFPHRCLHCGFDFFGKSRHLI